MTDCALSLPFDLPIAVYPADIDFMDHVSNATYLKWGAHWCDLPERYGRWKTVHRRFGRWCHAGVRERVFDTLAADRDDSYLMLDSIIVRAHPQAATGKGGPRTRRWGVPAVD